MSDHEVLDREDWAIARKIFLTRQARFTRSGERHNAERCELPQVDNVADDLPFDMHQ